jgi:hypothetical protein
MYPAARYRAMGRSKAGGAGLLVLRDDFSVDSSGSYTPIGTPTITVVGGEMVVVNSTAVSSQARRAFATTIGKRYRLIVNFRRVTGTAVARLRTSAGVSLGEVTNANATFGMQSIDMTATTVSSFVDLGNGGSASGNDSRFDTYSIYELP